MSWRDQWKVQIDNQAEAARLKWITKGYGQAIVYALKADEARRFKASPPAEPNPADWPFLSAEVGITGASLELVANAIVTIADQWIQIAAAIENLRLTRKGMVEEALDEQEASVACTAIPWPLPDPF